MFDMPSAPGALYGSRHEIALCICSSLIGMKLTFLQGSSASSYVGAMCSGLGKKASHSTQLLSSLTSALWRDPSCCHYFRIGMRVLPRPWGLLMHSGELY